MTKIYYTRFQKQFSKAQYNTYLNLLPQDLQSRAHRYFRWQDAQAFLLGKSLLLRGLIDAGLEGSLLLQQLKYTEYNRPYLSEKIDFNISHSGEYVVCAISDQCRVGLDIEKVEPRDLASFRSQMTDEEWEMVTTAADPQQAFLHYWTKKEAAIKAHGQGLSLGLKEVVIGDGEMNLEGKAWPLYEVEIASGYVCHLVTDEKINTADVPIKKVYVVA